MRELTGHYFVAFFSLLVFGLFGSATAESASSASHRFDTGFIIQSFDPMRIAQTSESEDEGKKDDEDAEEEEEEPDC